MSQKSRVTSKATWMRRDCTPYPASTRNNPSHSAPSPSVARVPGVARQGVPGIGSATQPNAAYGVSVMVEGVRAGPALRRKKGTAVRHRSEEHTSELQSLAYLVCRL